MERVPRPRSRSEISSALDHVQEAQAVRVGEMSSQDASAEQPTGRNQVSGTANGSGSTSAACSRTCFHPKP